MKTKSSSLSFLDDAERIIRKHASKNPQLVVWRGEYGRQMLDSVETHETIIAGLSDEPDSAQPPCIAILKVWFDGMVKIEFETGSDDDCYQLVPFGGSWNPLHEVEKLAKKLVAVF